MKNFIIHLLILLLSLTPFLNTPQYSVSAKFLVNEQSKSSIDLDSLTPGIGSILGTSSTGLMNSLESSSAIKNETLVKEMFSSRSKISKFIEKYHFRKYIFPGKWDEDRNDWKDRRFSDDIKFYIKSVNRSSEEGFKEISHIPTNIDLSNKLLKEHLFFNHNILDDTYEINCKFNSTSIAKLCIDNFLSFIDFETRQIHLDINTRLKDAIESYSNEVDVNKKKVLNNILLQTEINILKIENDPNYVLTILDDGLIDMRSSDTGRVTLSLIIFIFLYMLFFIYPIIKAFMINSLSELKSILK